MNEKTKKIFRERAEVVAQSMIKNKNFHTTPQFEINFGETNIGLQISKEKKNYSVMVTKTSRDHGENVFSNVYYFYKIQLIKKGE